ncbi:DNA-binding transcriptional regulator, LysR family [Pelagirhabdus alkalitolerans]|uniref:DNA-binding transcriptional regulator, LysR family n=1 Tax=Pelagirhabdus alkalitolerans TaxID=1612202 RepID=A0A1G6M249_9BACI|nr:LysR family transcriptional regulator [Pelagirhabdus alkalitolerans]SDC49374.1 DNA-binding transcriptional regulator, LysR family [Pelagirhabdus alkalitolerans]
MDIRFLHYFVTIVNCDFNMTRAAKESLISQPALSQMIHQFENNENITLFERSGGRLKKLTYAGDRLYTHAVDILKKHQVMVEEMQKESTELRGHVKIGIPPVVISIIFPDLLPTLIRDNPKIQLELLELGAVELRQQLQAKEIPIAALLTPTHLDESQYESHILFSDKLTAFVSADHPFAKKECLEWEDFDQQSIAIFDQSYMIHHQLKKQFKDAQVKPLIQLQSASWDLLLNSTRHSNLVTILPGPLGELFQTPEVKQIPIHDPIKWEVAICRRRQKYHSLIEDYIFKHIAKHRTDHNSL